MIGHARGCPQATGSCGPERQKSIAEGTHQNQPLDFESFVQRHQAEVFSIVTALAGHSLLADRIAQEVFVEAHRISRLPFRGFPSRLRLCEIAVRLALANANERSFERVHDEALNVLKGLNERDCALLVLREVLGYALPEISAVCGKRVDELRRDLFRIHRQAVALKSGMVR